MPAIASRLIGCLGTPFPPAVPRRLDALAPRAFVAAGSLWYEGDMSDERPISWLVPPAVIARELDAWYAEVDAHAQVSESWGGPYHVPAPALTRVRSLRGPASAPRPRGAGASSSPEPRRRERQHPHTHRPR